MAGNLETLRYALHRTDGYCNDHDPICRCRPIDVRLALGIIDKLDRTQDGVPIVPGMTVWLPACWEWDYKPASFIVERIGAKGENPTLRCPMGLSYSYRVNRLWSTREAAEEAAKKGGGA